MWLEQEDSPSCRQLAAGREMISYLDCGDKLLTADDKVAAFHFCFAH